MIFYFASILESGRVIEQEKFDSATFDRKAVADYLDLINEGEDFGEDVNDVHLEFAAIGTLSATIEMSSDKGDVIVHLLGNTNSDSAMKELADIFTTIHESEQAVNDVFQLKGRPLALAVIPDASADARTLSRYPIALAAAFFEAKAV